MAPSIEQCDHQKDLYRGGKLQGSWIEERAGNRKQIVCRHCGKFYGYLPMRKDKACELTTTSDEP